MMWEFHVVTDAYKKNGGFPIDKDFLQWAIQCPLCVSGNSFCLVMKGSLV